ncbi:MAG TPA: transglutaminase family protein [Candidatus Cybelea sp.]
MKRDDFLRQAAAVSILAGTPRLALAKFENDSFAPVVRAWRTFRLTTLVTLPGSTQPVRAWIPVPGFVESDWMRPGATTWETNATSASIVREGKWGVKVLVVDWLKPQPFATIKITSVVATRDRVVDLAKPGRPQALGGAEYALYTSATKLQPTDGIVADTAKKIVGSAISDAARAKLIYEWVVESASRNPKTRGCGLGDVSFMLETGDLSGKCADINGLYVALARAAGIPARDLYGIRVAPSAFGYHSLGTSSNTISKAQHCRAEVYLSEYGWVPADPADVRKVMLEEPPGHLALSDPKVKAARETLFGAWEGNYVAYNDGHDVALPGSSGDELGFLMYPQAEVRTERRDSLDPATFVYTIESEEMTRG